MLLLVTSLALFTATELPSAAVLPVNVRVETAVAQEMAALLTSTLTLKLAETGGYRVIGADEVLSLLEHEAERQRTGCADDGCLAEIAGALGAQLLVTGEVVSVGRNLTWTEKVLDHARGAVIRSASISGRTLQALASQVDEMAAALAGNTAALELSGPRARERLGFVDEEDLRAFKEYREEHPERTTSEALTRFVIERNLESPRLAVLEGALFSGATFLTIAVLLLGTTSVLGLLHVQNGGISLAASSVACLLAPVALLSGVAALVVSVVDAQDLGRVKVKRSGCCRQDSDIRDAAERDAVHRTAALAVLLGGPVSFSGYLMALLLYRAGSLGAGASGWGTTTPAIANSTNNLGRTLVDGLAAWCLLCNVGWCMVIAPWSLLVGTPVGVALLFRPAEEPLLDDEGEAP
ncbi:MAG: hypothetical protein AB2A00_23445 [Myxococcota bacterium]